MFFRKQKPSQANEDEFADLIARLRAERAEASPLELDEIKMRAIKQARAPRGSATTGARMRRTLVVAAATFSLMVSGTGAVIAGKNSKSDSKNDDQGGDAKDTDAAKKQYTHCKTQASAGSAKSQKANGVSNPNSGSANSQKSQDCPTPPPTHHSNNASHAGGSHMSHRNSQSQGSHSSHH